MKKWQKVLSAMAVAVVFGVGAGVANHSAEASLIESQHGVTGNISGSRAWGRVRTANVGRFRVRHYFVEGGQLHILNTSAWGPSNGITIHTPQSTAPVNLTTSRLGF